MPDTVIDSFQYGVLKLARNSLPLIALCWRKCFRRWHYPDARGDLIRIWDDGRGIDVGRTHISQQSPQLWISTIWNCGRGRFAAVLEQEGGKPEYWLHMVTGNS